MEHFNLDDFLTLLRRNMRLFALVTLVILVLGATFALNWSTYTSEATIEIAQPEILTNYTETSKEASVEKLVDLQISRLSQRVLSTGSLIEIITKFDLYPQERRAKPMAEIASAMRKKVNLDLIGSSLANPASAQKASADQLAAIAFTLSFSINDPALAQRVTNELVSRFLDENAQQRRSQAKETNTFLDSQLKALEQSLAEQEEKIAAFRETHGDNRPETLTFNQQAMASTQMSLQTIEAQISTNLGSQGALRAQLAATDPYSRLADGGRVLTTPTSQLKALKSEQAALTARYGANHPDVLKINRQVAALEAQTDNVNISAPLQARLTDVTTKLATARSQYGATSPDVLSLQKEEQGLRHQVAVERAKGALPLDGTIMDADNPAYLQIVAQLRASVEQGRALVTQRDELNKQLAKYRSAVVQNPQAEQQFAALSRNYDNAQLRYRELKANKLAAATNETIEQERNGQRLVVINPPELPTHTSPSRIVFLGLAFILALAGGVGSVLGKQLLTQRIIGPRHLEGVVGATPLVVVPHITTNEEAKGRLRLRKRAAVASVAGFILFLILFSSLVMPLDVLGIVLLRRLGL